MPLRWAGKQRLLLVAGVFAAAVIFFLSTQSVPPANPATNNAADTTRTKYAELYQAAWRQDAGRGSILVTATLLAPPTREALGQDTGRSSTEEQVWDAVRNLDAKAVPVALSIDSVAGAVDDATIRTSLKLTAAGGPDFQLSEWRPLIAPSRVVNAQSTTSSQYGIAVFTAPRDLDWQTLGSLTLTMSGVGDQPERVFNWAEPRLLLEV